MQLLTFITNTDGRSGKVASRETRTVIRAHVMRKHWTDKPAPSASTLVNLCSRQREAVEPFRLSSPPIQDADDDGTDDPSHQQTTRGALTGSAVIPGTTNVRGVSLSRHLNRVTDEFVYAGSSIDLQSYGYFHHYSMEFSIILPNSIQPLPLKKLSASCLAAVQQRSPILLDTICFMAAFHECMKRTKDSYGRLVTTFSDQKALRYKTNTLRKLSDHLINTPQAALVTEADILCVTILLFSETIAGDRSAVDAHCLGLTRMVSLFGGQDCLSPVVASHLRLVTLLAAQLDQTPPILPLPAHMQDRFDLVSAVPLPSKGYTFLGSAFFSEPLKLKWSVPLQQCLRYMCQVIVRIEKLQQSMKVIDGEWMDDVLILKHVLVFLPHGQPPLSQLEECVRIAALLYCNTALWRIPLYFRWVMSLVVHLKAAVILLDQSSIGWTYCGLRFWLLFLGRQACTLEFSAVETAWWNTSINQVAGELGVMTWKDAQRVLQEYLYIDGAYTARWEAVWNDVVQGNASAEPVRDPKHPCDFI